MKYLVLVSVLLLAGCSKPSSQPLTQTALPPSPAPDPAPVAEKAPEPSPQQKEITPFLHPSDVIKRCGNPVFDKKGKMLVMGSTTYTRALVYEGTGGLVGVYFSGGIQNKVSLNGVKELRAYGNELVGGPLQSAYNQEGQSNIRTLLPCVLRSE